ncbi:MAG: hypothetical protein ACOYYU_13780 [Chloroflexota bacterium]
MKSAALLLFLATILSLVLTGCAPSPSLAAPTAIPPTPTMTPIPKGEKIIVTSAEDSGSGTLRQALLEAQPGDTITFDEKVFPPEMPTRILLASCLPGIYQDYLTIDASDAGVVLDGEQIESDWCPGFIVVSNWNSIRGLRFEGFSPGAGIELTRGAQHNLIGGDPNTGLGPQGQGNVVGYGDVGFVLGGGATSNIITGNFIGVDPEGRDLEQTSVGIWIEYGAAHNTIGPGNVIAYNTNGIVITDSASIGNTITGNSIYDNEWAGIELEGNDELIPPSIVNFDLEIGSAAGVACSSCLIEIFSDDGNQGRIYEGMTTADDAGNFIFNRGSPFSAARLTATATDIAGNTSRFSEPTFGSNTKVVFQEGNNLPKTQIIPKRSTEILDNRLGEMNPIYSWECETYAQYASDLAYRADELGIKWMRVSFEWFDWAELENYGRYSDFQIDSCQKQTIEALHQGGTQVIYNLTFWDPVFSYYPGYSRFRDEGEIERFVEFTRFIVGNLKGNITWYSILNEPNIRGEDQRYVKANDYIVLVHRVVPIIRELDPQAKIIIGEVTPLDDSFDYLMQILESDIMPLVDGIAWHGSGEHSLEYSPKLYNSYPFWVDQVVQTARDHGFKGEFFSTELHWRTPETSQPFGFEPWFYSDIVAAKYYARGIIFHRGKGFFTGIGHERYEQVPPIKRVVRNLATLLAGAEPEGLPVETQSEATNITSYGFSLPNGDKLFALWTDGVAVDNDPGIPATLTFPGISAQTVVGIDVLYGVEQQLITESIDGNLVIRDLLVKDYPIILRLSP